MGENSSDEDCSDKYDETIIITKKPGTPMTVKMKKVNPCENGTERNINDIFMAQYQNIYWSTGDDF